jgi:protein-L-isoaspartate(D-aspartate) O-methyltransferase
MIDVTDSERAARLRDGLAGALAADGMITSPGVAAAFRTVPRHLFAPGIPLEEAYAPDRVVTKRDEHGVTVSSVSAPQIQATMLEQAGLDPGMRVLEIGSGGYNAALAAELVGPSGQVTSADIDPEVTARASCCLAQAGYGRVEVVLGDGEHGWLPRAPFDRIIVTAGAWDIPPAWTDQLAGGGRITVPLRMRGLTRSVALERDGCHLVSRSARLCGFVAMQGAGAHQERLLLLRGKEIGLRLDDGDLPDPHLLTGALGGPPAHAWSGVMLGRAEPFDSLQLWLATVLDGFCLLTVNRELDTGLVRPANRIASPAMAAGASFAYLAARPSGEDTVELGADAFGPGGPALAEALTGQVRAWDRSYRRGPEPRIEVYPARTPDEELPAGLVMDKRHSRITVSWPPAQRPAGGQDAPPPPR